MSLKNLLKIDFAGEEQVPDATTLCKFRKLPNENGIIKLLFDTMKAFMDRHGKLMHGGAIADATVIEAPTSTKNAEKKRDPEMHAVKKDCSVCNIALNQRLPGAGDYGVCDRQRFF